jgi:hypothetical protein
MSANCDRWEADSCAKVERVLGEVGERFAVGYVNIGASGTGATLSFAESVVVFLRGRLGV